jgi:hypothetical protein
LTRFIVLSSIIKFSLPLSLAAFVVTELGTTIPLTWPLISLLLNVFVLGWHLHAAGSSYVGGMVPPGGNSSNAYIHYFHSMHLFFHRAPTAKDMLKVITRETKE